MRPKIFYVVNSIPMNGDELAHYPNKKKKYGYALTIKSFNVYQLRAVVS